jgi:hypothetical protein
MGHQTWTPTRCRSTRLGGRPFASGRFDYEWALWQLRAVVKLTRKIEPAHKVIERLADCVDKQPLRTLLAFEEVVEADKQGWLVSLARKDAERLLRAALARDESGTCGKARGQKVRQSYAVPTDGGLAASAMFESDLGLATVTRAAPTLSLI